MNQPKPGTKAYSGLLEIATYRDCYGELSFYNEGQEWEMRLRHLYENAFSHSVFRRMEPFIAGRRRYVNGKLVEISNARVEVQFVPAEIEEKSNGK